MLLPSAWVFPLGFGASGEAGRLKSIRHSGGEEGFLLHISSISPAVLQAWLIQGSRPSPSGTSSTQSPLVCALLACCIAWPWNCWHFNGRPRNDLHMRNDLPLDSTLRRSVGGQKQLQQEEILRMTMKACGTLQLGGRGQGTASGEAVPVCKIHMGGS